VAIFSDVLPSSSAILILMDGLFKKNVNVSPECVFTIHLSIIFLIKTENNK